jgi:hypothetical protein
MGINSGRPSFPRKRESTPQTLGNVLSSDWIPALAGMTALQMTPVPAIGRTRNNIGIGRSGKKQPGIGRAGDRAKDERIQNSLPLQPISRSTNQPTCYWRGNGTPIFWGSPLMCEVSLLRTFSSTVVISALDIFTTP